MAIMRQIGLPWHREYVLELYFKEFVFREDRRKERRTSRQLTISFRSQVGEAGKASGEQTTHFPNTRKRPH